MIRKILAFAAAGLMMASPAVMAQNKADKTDSEGRLEMWVRGSMTNGWSCQSAYKFSREGDVYTISLAELDGEFKVSGSEWVNNFGANSPEKLEIGGAVAIEGVSAGANFIARDLKDVTIKFEMSGNEAGSTILYISANGEEAPAKPVVTGLSGTLPVLYINVYNAEHTAYDNEVIDRNLDHKNYFSGEYWLETNGCKWLEDLGAKPVGSADEPLPLEIKARGNWTRKGYSKKPFKLKLGKKQSLLGLSKSKHFAILAHADDNCSYLRNFTGFNLGRRIGLPWTPWQQPCEVVINGQYRGLYFLTESIRVDADRVNITELGDNVTDASLVSGGYLIELDNYDEENQIRMEEKTCVSGYPLDMLRITWDTPEVYSDLQQRFITDQFTAMNNLVGANSDELWSYLDLDDAARYYLVEEIISHVESYHGSTYLFRDHGEGQKWHFSPLWDCGNAFNGSSSLFFYDNTAFGNTWIPSMRQNAKFNQKVKDTWMWFMTNGYDGLIEDIDEYVAAIEAAAKADHKKWANQPLPDYPGAQPVVNNSDIKQGRDRVVTHLNEKTEWLKGQFGDFSAVSQVAEPERDNTAAAPLPEYAKVTGTAVEVVELGGSDLDWEYYNLQGMRVAQPKAGEVYIRVCGERAEKVVF